ncbi:DNA cytosine methyltransferase [Roseospira marina]|uniref:DNA (cytosine-5-)-methyltransferase n=2 Tax=Roseospira marina TaxID=140057 RepID=A0A5M6ID14_9PROT|nr:DNA cytosine methyltransferase [Roseospira marina]
MVDSFAGGGGASTGIEMALGRSPDVAINHDPVAIAMHTANHPDTRHFCQSIYTVSPAEATRGRPVGLLWASPDCRHFSKAKGGKPVSSGVRDLAWVVVEWARRARPRVIILENVEEFQTWGPIDRAGKPCPERKGQTFTLWVAQLRRLGYRVEWRELRACDYGAPTSRKRLFVIARRDGQPIVWPEPTHGAPDSPEVRAGARKPWRTAAEIIDWSLPVHSIFLSPEEARAVGVKRPLAEATLRRVARGIVRYVLDHPRPFVIPVTHGGDARCWDSREPLRTITTAKRGEMMVVAPSLVRTDMQSGAKRNGVHDPGSPLRTITTGGGMAMVAPTLVQTGYGERPGQAPRVPGLDKPLGTAVASGAKHALVSAFLARHYGDQGQRPGTPLDEPTSTVTAVDHNSLVTAHIQRQFGQSVGSATDAPLGTVTGGGGGKAAVCAAHLTQFRGSNQGNGGDITAPAPTVTGQGTHVGLIAPFLTRYYGEGGQWAAVDDPLCTVTTKDRMSLVTVHLDGVPYVVTDIALRMLSPRELFRAQGFPDDYRIDIEIDGRPVSKAQQVRCAGNSVCPPLAAALVTANVPEMAAAPLPDACSTEEVAAS